MYSPSGLEPVLDATAARNNTVLASAFILRASFPGALCMHAVYYAKDSLLLQPVVVAAAEA